MDRLRRYPWPGNIRELENLTRRLAALYPQEVISEQLIETELGSERAAAEPGASRSPPISRGGHRESGAAQEQFVSGLERHVAELFRSFGDSLCRRSASTIASCAISKSPLIAATLAVTRGNQIKAAEILGLNRNTLRKKIRDLDLRGVRGLK